MKSILWLDNVCSSVHLCTSFHTKIYGQKYNNIWLEMVLPDHDYDYDYD